MGTDEIAAPQLSVSTIPVRWNADTALEVFVQHRAATMDFAAHAVVFPGGRVDAKDYRPVPGENLPESVLDRHQRAWSRSSIAEHSPERARELCRVLLRCCRREVEEETGWVLVPEEVVPWANWVTPPDLPKRFDTYFFVAHVPTKGVLGHRTTEAQHSQWRAVGSLLSDYKAGRVRLMRPTLSLLRSLADVSQAGVLSAPSDVVMPRRPLRSRAY